MSSSDVATVTVTPQQLSSGTWTSFNRNVTLLWVLYPVMLFSLPNEIRIAGLPPETLLACVYLTLFLISILACEAPVSAPELVRAIPGPVLLFALGVLIATMFKGDALAVFRVVSWFGVLLISMVLFRDEKMRALLWKAWLAIGSGTALYALMKHGWAWPERVDILAWMHRTVLGYFLAMSLLLGIYLSAFSQGIGRLLCLIGAAICAAALIASKARGAWLFTLVCMLILVRNRDTRKWVLLGAAIVITGVVVATAAGGSGFSDRVLSIVDMSHASSNLYRANLYLAAVTSLPESWLWGAPTLQFGPYLVQFTPFKYAPFFDPDFATDSDIIHVLLLGGLPLLAALIFMVLDRVRLLWRKMRRGGAVDPRVWLLALLCAQILLDNVFSNALGWMYVGILASMQYESGSEMETLKPALHGPARKVIA